MTTKIYCDGAGTTDYDGPRERDGDRFVKCRRCTRVVKLPEGRDEMRQHQVRGKSTASQDRTFEILYSGAA